jgi:deoxyribonuclease-1
MIIKIRFQSQQWNKSLKKIYAQEKFEKSQSSGMGAYSIDTCIWSKFKEWREGHPACVDRKGKPFKEKNCARKRNIKFRYMESDLYNLVPAIGEINGLRSNYRFEMIPGEKREFGTCDMEIENRQAEPRLEVRGDIARIYFYMNWAYLGHGIISKKNRKLFGAWDKEDPVDDWECERSKKIEGIQRNENPFVKKACVEVGKW